MSAEIKAVTFDVGGTLIKPWPSVGHVYAAVAEKHGWKNVSPDALNRRFAMQWKRLRDFQHTREEWAGLVDKTFAEPVERPPSETFFPEIYERFAAPDAWHVFEDVLPTLDALAGRGINLGIISNWDERLVPLLEKLGLLKYFEAVIVSCEAGFSKPSPVVFELAARKFGQPAEGILHIGDSQEHDFQGAIAAGFQAAVIDRELHGVADGRIASLRDVLRMID